MADQEEYSAVLHHPSIKIGDRARFPLGRLGDDVVYPRTWEAVAFRPNGCIITRRLHDGIERVLSLYWWERYTLDERRAILWELQPVRRLPLPRLNSDRSAPGYYVSARQYIAGQYTQRYVLLAGPFSDNETAKRWISRVRTYISSIYCTQYDRGEIHVGTCKVQDGTRDGRFNQELGVQS